MTAAEMAEALEPPHDADDRVNIIVQPEVAHAAARMLRDLDRVRAAAARIVALVESVDRPDTGDAYRDLRAALARVGGP